MPSPSDFSFERMKGSGSQLKQDRLSKESPPKLRVVHIICSVVSTDVDNNFYSGLGIFYGVSKFRDRYFQSILKVSKFQKSIKRPKSKDLNQKA